MKTRAFDSNCQQCPRLATFLADVKQEHPDYFCRPVPPFGDKKAHLLIVGLAPGKHGANASGRPFTGDYAGVLLYQTLYDFGFSTAHESLHARDGLKLRDCRITNAVKCLPPENKPTTGEVKQCNRYLAAELADLPADGVVLALGTVAHNAVLKALGLRQSSRRFAHAAEHGLPRSLMLLDSYHCSRYNTQTGRLTDTMFDAVFARARTLLDDDREARRAR
jgi:uracil-DNA glycosylase family 4